MVLTHDWTTNIWTTAGKFHTNRLGDFESYNKMRDTWYFDVNQPVPDLINTISND